MPHTPFTDADREIARSVMAAAEDRAAARAETPAAPPPPARRLTNRRGAPPPAPGAETRARPQISGKVASLVGGLVLALALVALASRSGPLARTDHRPPTTDHPADELAAPPSAVPAATAQSAQVAAYAAPGGAQLGPIDANAPIAYRHSDYPEWGGVRWQGAIVWVKTDAQLGKLPDLARPTPAPTPVYVYVEPPCDPTVNPRYVAQIDVSVDGRPLGQVTGQSCDSQAAAQADAETQAAAMRASAPTPCPTWAGPPFVKPDCAT